MKPALLLVSIATILFAQDSFRPVKTMLSGESSVSFREVESTDFKRTYQYKINPATISASNRDGYSAVELSGVENTDIPRVPSLPGLTQRFIVPAGMTLDSVTVLSEKSSVQKLDMPVTFADEYIPEVHRGNFAATVRNDSLYSSAGLFPAKVAELTTVQKQSGVSIAFITLTPLQFRGKSNELVSTYEFSLKFHYSPTPVSRSGDNSAVYPNRVDTDLLGVENPEEIQSYKRRSRSSGTPEAQYLILTNREFLNANAPYTVRDLAERRRSQGLSVKIVTVDSIYENVSSSLDWAPNGVIDRQAKIRYFLSEAYRDWGVEYVIIAGDTNVVPVRMLTPRMRFFGGWVTENPVTKEDSTIYKHTFVPSDYYYQCLDGIYNAPLETTVWAKKHTHLLDKWWGSPVCGSETEKKLVDILPEFALGRVPADNPYEFSNWLSKQFTYENTHIEDVANKKVLFAGEKTGFFFVGHDAYTGEKSLEEIRLGSENHGLSTKGFTALPDINTETLYTTVIDKEVDEWLSGDVVDRINTDEIGVICHIGHGTPNRFMKQSNSDLNVWKNQKPIFVYSQTCLAGRFIEECVVEDFLTKHSTHGLWGGVFNTGYGYKDDAMSSGTDGPSQRMNRFFWHHYVKSDNPVVRLGDMNNAAKQHSIERATIGDDEHLYVIYSSSLFGDPYAELRIANRNLSHYLYLTSPVGSNTLLLNKSQKITWHATSSENVTLSILSQNGTATDIGTTAGSAGEFTWTPSEFASAGIGFRIVIKNGSMTDTSAAFDISETISLHLTEYPTGTLTKGEVTAISWESEDPATSVWLIRSGEPDSLLAETDGSGALDWTVPMTKNSGKEYRIRVIGSQSRNIPVESEPFRIASKVIDHFPFTENFDDVPTGSQLPDHWEQLDSDSRDWRIQQGLTITWDYFLNSGNFWRETLFDKVHISGPTEDRTGGNYCYMNGVQSKGSLFQMTTPLLDLRGCTGSQLSFWLHMFSTTSKQMGTFKVELIREGKADALLYEQTEHTDQFDTLALKQEGPFSTVEHWKKHEISLSNYEGDIVQIRFSGLALHRSASDIAIDDIEVTVGNQEAVSVLNESTKNTLVTDQLIVVPSIVTNDVSVAKIYHKKRKQFSFNWRLYNAVGDLLESGEGDYSGNGTAVDYIDVSGLRGYTGATVLFLTAADQDGKVTIYKTSVGFKK